jgi:hypothetical protein
MIVWILIKPITCSIVTARMDLNHTLSSNGDDDFGKFFNLEPEILTEYLFTDTIFQDRMQQDTVGCKEDDGPRQLS